MSTLSQRPENPVVGLALHHEAAAQHVTGEALYTDDLVYRTPRALPSVERAVGWGASSRSGPSPPRPVITRV